jgi:two-component system chemotaxis response regulator CheB
MLPASLPAAVLLVLHMPGDSPSALVRILGRVSELPVQAALDGDPLQPGRIVVARPDRHLVVRDSRIHLGRGPRENGHRPAVDPLFRSVARWFGEHVIAVVCSGALDDGAAGALAIAGRGGTVLIQDPTEAMYDGMPSAALRAVPTATTLPLASLAGAAADRVKQLGRLEEPAPVSVPSELALEAAMAELDEAALQDVDRPGVPAGLACPDCHGALFEIDEEVFVRFRCRVGHAWSPDSLLVQQHEELESALWMALRALEDKSALHRRMAENARNGGHSRLASASDHLSSDSARSATVIRELLLRQGAATQTDGDGGPEEHLASG